MERILFYLYEINGLDGSPLPWREGNDGTKIGQNFETYIITL